MGSVTPWPSTSRPRDAPAHGQSEGRYQLRRSRGGIDDIRAWARENGFTVSDRGRIPATVEAAYNAR